jgi:sulfur carrier protein
MNITINGSPRRVSEGTTTAEAIQLLTTASTGIAVAVNGQVVTRSAWESTTLTDGDQVEVLTAVQGG